jgi:multidrug efflux pump subunit AcrB
LGIVVDDAIVVGEAIHHRQKTGLKGVDAAIAGVRDVAVPVTFSVLTTIIAFTPLLFIPGVTGRFVRNIPLIVISVFVISLIESLFILPAHLAHSHEKPVGGLLGAAQRAQAVFSRAFDRFIERFFRPTLQPALRARYLTLAIALAGVILSIGLVAAGKVKFTYMPRVESDVVSASLRMPFGTPVERTREIVDRMIAELDVVLDEHGGDDITRGIYASIGSGAESFGPGGGGSGGSHVASVSLNMVPIDDRSVTAGEVARQWRERIGEVAGAEVLSFNFSTGPSAGAPISVRLSHSDIQTLENAAERLAEHLGTYQGVIDIDSGVSYGKEQLDLELSPMGRAAGLTESDLARQVRSAFFGAEAARQQRGRDELRVYVRRPESERRSEHFVETMIVRTPDGGEMPLDQAAEILRGRAYTSISRVNGRRIITVTADVIDGVANAGEVSGSLADNVLPSLLNDVPGLTFDFAGEREDQQKSMAAMKTGLGLSLLGMFALMAAAFRSYLQPLIIMSAIPFGIVGAMIGHILMGYSVSMLSVFGMVALSGVVVNDSLLLVTTINEYRSNGMTTFDAVVTGAVRRFRPILMTSLTTFFGLAPMILETSVQARFLIPMAISLGFGILFVTVITLALVPCLYLVIEDVVRAARWTLRQGAGER